MEEIATFLSSPFVVAEMVATMSLEGTGFENRKPLIHELSNKAQLTLMTQLVDTDTRIALGKISVNWNTGLRNFFDDFLCLFPGGLLPTSAWNRLNKSVFFFPTDGQLDWIRLFDLFIRIWRELPKPVGYTERKYLQIAFSLTCQHLAFQRLPYEETVVNKHVTEMGNELEKVYKEKLFYSLKYYGRPPLQDRLVEVEEVIARLNKGKLYVSTFEIPPFGKPGDRMQLPSQYYIDSLDTLLKLYEGEANVLLATIRREADKADSTLVTPIQPASDLPVKLTHSQIAILYHCNGERITRNNRDSIAQKFGQTSGQRLEAIYGQFTSELNRIAKGKYTIKNYEAIIGLPQLTQRGKAQAESELKKAREINEK